MIVRTDSVRTDSLFLLEYRSSQSKICSQFRHSNRSNRTPSIADPVTAPAEAPATNRTSNVPMTAPVAEPTIGTTEPIAAPVPAPLSAPATPPAIPPTVLPMWRSLIRSDPHSGHIVVISVLLLFQYVKKAKRHPHVDVRMPSFLSLVLSYQLCLSVIQCGQRTTASSRVFHQDIERGCKYLECCSYPREQAAFRSKSS
ncbi:Uncharacterised protein [Serratia fonticola]|nr:Uncharacterised protein [Serratia fonticola]